MNKLYTYGLLTLSIFLLMSCSKSEHHIIVGAAEGLSTEKVEIRYGFTSINRKNDQELFSANLKTVFNGKDKENLETDFGENDFLLIYDDAYYYSFRHFILTDFQGSYPAPHEYNIELFMQHDSIFMTANITGEQPMEFTRPLIEKEKAAQFRCNTPIAKAGVMFNMKEMEEKE